MLNSLFLSLAMLVPAMGQQDSPRQEEKKDQFRLRLICISCLESDQEVTLASRNEKGEWLELGKAGLRSSFIGDWLPAKPGELHLALPGNDGLKSICNFNYPADARRALVVLIADPSKRAYRAIVLDPDKLAFSKGSLLAINFSNRSGIVVLGSKKILLDSGGKKVLKPALEQNGMYRMLVAYEDAEKKIVPCYDRYVQGNPDSRDLLFLIPDQTVGLKVFTLPIFGDFN